MVDEWPQLSDKDFQLFDMVRINNIGCNSCRTFRIVELHSTETGLSATMSMLPIMPVFTNLTPALIPYFCMSCSIMCLSRCHKSCWKLWPGICSFHLYYKCSKIPQNIASIFCRTSTFKSTPRHPQITYLVYMGTSVWETDIVDLLATAGLLASSAKWEFGS